MTSASSTKTTCAFWNSSRYDERLQASGSGQRQAASYFREAHVVKILVSWLRDFVDITASPDDIARTMSVRGFAVESIEPVRIDSSEADRESGPLSQRWLVGSQSD